MVLEGKLSLVILLTVATWLREYLLRGKRSPPRVNATGNGRRPLFRELGSTVVVLLPRII